MKTKTHIEKHPFGATCKFAELEVGDNFLYYNKLYVKIPATQFVNCMAVESGVPIIISAGEIVEAVDVSISIWRKEKLDEQ